MNHFFNFLSLQNSFLNSPFLNNNNYFINNNYIKNSFQLFLYLNKNFNINLKNSIFLNSLSNVIKLEFNSYISQI